MTMKTSKNAESGFKFALPLAAIAAILAAGALALATLWPGLTLGQDSGSAGSSITVERTPYLSFIEIPDSFSFSTTATGGNAHHVFNTPDGAISTGKFLAVSDTRNSGGFVVQTQSTDFTSGANSISAANLRVVSTSSLAYSPGSIVVGDIHYYTGFSGTPNLAETQTVKAPVNASGTNFSQAATFDEVQNRPENNTLNTPVDIMSGCLTAGQGRIGTMGVGMAFDLLIPPYAFPGTYNSTITYTIIDYTEDPCP
jgi:hypothetical protein